MSRRSSSGTSGPPPSWWISRPSSGGIGPSAGPSTAPLLSPLRQKCLPSLCLPLSRSHSCCYRSSPTAKHRTPPPPSLPPAVHDQCGFNRRPRPGAEPSCGCPETSGRCLGRRIFEFAIALPRKKELTLLLFDHLVSLFALFMVKAVFRSWEGLVAG